MTVSEYLAYLRPFYPQWDCDLEASILRRLRLPVDRRIGDLSHGMRMKNSLACALPFRPKLLVLDEPLSGLDPLVRDEFIEGLLDQAAQMTILISSHELSEIEGMVTHVGFLDQGKLLFAESMSDLASRFRDVRVVLEDLGRSQGKLPEHWLGLQTTGNVLTFVDTRFSEARFGEQIAAFVAARAESMRSRWRCGRYLQRWPAPAAMRLSKKKGNYDLAHFQEGLEAGEAAA